MFVEILVSDSVVGRVKRGPDGGVLFSSGLQRLGEILQERGVIFAGARLFPDDEERFLRALPVALSGSYVRARLVEE